MKKTTFTHRLGPQKLPKLLCIAGLAAAGMTLGIAPASATYSCSGSGNSPESPNSPVSGAAEFTLNTAVSPKTLTLVLKNTLSSATLNPASTLTGVVFNIGGNTAVLSYNDTNNPALGPLSHIWTSGSTTLDSTALFDATGSSWTNQKTSSTFGYGVATTGFNGLFKGSSIKVGNANPDYAIVAAKSFPGSIGGSQFPWIQNSLQFVFTTTNTFTEADITNVRFLYGTAGGATVGSTCLVKSYDYGDAPDTGVGTGGDNYNTLLNDNGPRHDIVTGLTLGTNVDGETNGQPMTGALGDDANGTPDDEDAVGALAFTYASNPSFDVSVTNKYQAANPVLAGQAAYLQCWMDLDGDGSFTTTAKEASGIKTIPAYSGSGTGMANYNVSFGTLTATNTTYARCRVSLDALEVSTPVGLANSGEVEDHKVTVATANLDLGDAPDTGASTASGNYNTLLSLDRNGPRHVITPNLKLGTVIDAEANGQPTVNAEGDNINGIPDDEDGIAPASLPYISNQSTEAKLKLNVKNTTGNPATLSCWMDLNKDGVFANTESKAIAVNSSPTVNPITLPTFGINTKLAVNDKIYIRCRIASNSAEVANPTGLANSGEVEDYLVTVANEGSGSEQAVDFGDAPDIASGAQAATATELPDYETKNAPDNGPNHGTSASIYLGSIPPSPENDSGLKENDFATADDGDGYDDEDGVLPSGIPTIHTLSTTARLAVRATNSTATPGVLACWIDFNRNGVFESTEKSATTVAANTTFYNYLPNFSGFSFHTDPALRTGKTFIRCRIASTTDWPTTAAAIPTGGVNTGEVEDYAVTIYDHCTTPIPATVIKAPAPTSPSTQPPAGTPGYKFEFNALAGGSTIDDVSMLSCHKTINYNLAWTVFKDTQGGNPVTPLDSSAPPVWNFNALDTLYVEMYQNNTSSALLACTVKDTNQKECALDPLFVSTSRVKGKPVAEQVTMVLDTETGKIIDYYPVSNDFPWAKVTAEGDGAKLEISVNGKIFKFKGKDLIPGVQEVQYIGSALSPKGNNIVYLKPTGKPDVRINVSFDENQ